MSQTSWRGSSDDWYVTITLSISTFISISSFSLPLSLPLLQTNSTESADAASDKETKKDTKEKDKKGKAKKSKKDAKKVKKDNVVRRLLTGEAMQRNTEDISHVILYLWILYQPP